jgi:poly-gamma-glutamate capsule biosynthesis protein CapA/YwtB (metallophosphatase superfamily)
LKMMKIPILTILLVMFGLQKTGRFDSSEFQNSDKKDKLTLLFMGDVMQHIPQIESARDKNTGTYHYDSCFKYISGEMSAADIAIANLEVTLAGPPYTGYPCFSAPDSLVTSLVRAGTDVLVTANNHCCDKGLKGIRRTVSILDSLGIPHTGTYPGPAYRDSLNPLILEKKGIILALLNYTYGTNGNAIPSPAVVDLTDTALIRKDYLKARQKGVDEVIAFFHWGEEYKPYPDKKQKELADFCHHLGIRIVIGSHPHVIEPMIAQKDSMGNIAEVTVYSLGNFISNQRDRYRNGGALFSVSLTREQDAIRISDPGYKLAWVHTPFRYGKVWYQVLPVRTFENDTAYFGRPDLLKMREFARDARALLDTANVNVPEL